MSARNRFRVRRTTVINLSFPRQRAVAPSRGGVASPVRLITSSKVSRSLSVFVRHFVRRGSVQPLAEIVQRGHVLRHLGWLLSILGLWLLSHDCRHHCRI